MRRPSLGDFYSLDADTIRTEYILTKAARIAGEPQRVMAVHNHPHATTTTFVFLVTGDTKVYTVWLRPFTTPWTAACSRGGIHDAQPEGEACSHGLAAAVAYELAREQVTS